MLWCLPEAADATVGQLITWHIFCHVTNDHLADVAIFGHAGTGASRP